MQVTVVHFHPVEASFSSAVLAATVEGLGAHDVNVARVAEGESPTAALTGADALVAVYPTWWGGLPAQLLDWVQRDLGPWIDGREPSTTSPLAFVQRLAVVTTHGSTRFMNGLQGEPGRHLWSRSIARLCAPGTRLRWIAFYGIDRSDDAARAAFLDRVRHEMAVL